MFNKEEWRYKVQLRIGMCEQPMSIKECTFCRNLGGCRMRGGNEIED